MLEDAGFTEIRVDAVGIERRAPDFAAWWAMQLDLSAATREVLERVSTEEAEAVAAEVAARFAPYTNAAGELAVPGRTLVAVATA